MIKKITFYLLLTNIIVAPLYIVRWRIFWLPTTLLEVTLLTTISFWLFYAVTSRQLSKFKKIIYSDRLFKPILIILISAVISLLTTNDLRGGLGIFKAYFFEPIFIYFVYRTINYQNKNKFVFMTFLLSVVCLAIISIIQLKFGRLIFFAPSEIAQGRITAVYNSANSLALYLGPILTLSLVRLTDPKKVIKIFAYLCFVLILITVYLTKSQGAYLGVISSLSLFLIINQLQTKLSKVAIKRLVFTIFTLIVFVGLFLPLMPQIYPKLTPPVNNINYQGSNTFLIRNYLWKGTIDLLKDRPLTGTGLNGFKPLYFNNYRLPQYHEALQYPHNIYLTFWTELGFLGFVGFLLLVKKLVGLITQGEKINFGLLVFLSYILIHGIVDVPYFKNDLSLEFWLVLALLV